MGSYVGVVFDFCISALPAFCQVVLSPFTTVGGKVSWSTRTIDNRLDLGDLQHFFQIIRPEVAHAQRTALQCTVCYQPLEPAPELAEVARFGDERVVYK